MILDKNKIILELERFIEFSKHTQLIKANYDDFDNSGHPMKDFLSYPKGAAGIHLYWDAEIENIQTAQLLLEYFKDGVDIQRDAFPRLPFPNYIKIKINTMNYILLNPQFENLIVGETNRGVELLLLLWLKQDWKKIHCYDQRISYAKLIKEFFKDDRIVCHNQTTCTFDFNLLTDDNYLFVLNHSLGWGSKHWVVCPQVKMIIKDGIIVDPNQHWKSHMSKERIDQVYEELQIEIEKRFGRRVFEYILEE